MTYKGNRERERGGGEIIAVGSLVLNRENTAPISFSPLVSEIFPCTVFTLILTPLCILFRSSVPFVLNVKRVGDFRATLAHLAHIRGWNVGPIRVDFPNLSILTPDSAQITFFSRLNIPATERMPCDWQTANYVVTWCAHRLRARMSRPFRVARNARYEQDNVASPTIAHFVSVHRSLHSDCDIFFYCDFPGVLCVE